MPLHPQAQMMIDQMAAMGGPPLNELPIEDARMFAGAMAGLTGEKEAVKHIEDRTIPAPGGPVPVRIYRPEGTGPLPIVVNIHGGGWVIGDLEIDDAACRALANAVGAVFVSVEYRLAPEAQFPGPLDDCQAALMWAYEHAAEIGGDPSRLAVMGESAGGNLTAALALRLRDQGGPPLRFQLLIYPALDSSMGMQSYVECADGYFLTRDLMAWGWGHYLGDADPSDPYASPSHAPDLSGLPPTLVITAEFDPLRDEGHAYAERLRAAGVAAEDHCYSGMFHGFHLMGAVLDTAVEAIDDCAGVLRRAFSIPA